MYALLYKGYKSTKWLIVMYIVWFWIIERSSYGASHFYISFFLLTFLTYDSDIGSVNNRDDESCLNSLPISRDDIVRARYLLSLIIGITAMVSYYILDKVFYLTMGVTSFTNYLYEFLILILVISVVHPVYSWISSKYKIIILLAVFLLVLFSIGITKLNPLLVVLAIIVILPVSYRLSLIGYNKKEF